ncbi:hypothetical protein KJ807_05525 [Patescibacteria group bacterium]|nr:hypothetical protein [Patescibacteria group bacterium]
MSGIKKTRVYGDLILSAAITGVAAALIEAFGIGRAIAVPIVSATGMPVQMTAALAVGFSVMIAQIVSNAVILNL